MAGHGRTRAYTHPGGYLPEQNRISELARAGADGAHEAGGTARTPQPRVMRGVGHPVARAEAFWLADRRSGASLARVRRSGASAAKVPGRRLEVRAEQGEVGG